MKKYKWRIMPTFKMKKDILSIIISLGLKISIFITIATFAIIMGFIMIKGISHLDLKLFDLEYNSENISMTPAIINTINMILLSLLIVLPVGIFGAIFLNEYARGHSKIISSISIATETLVGIPSIVYGMFGYLIFVNYFGFKNSFLAGSLTLSIMILPLILRSSQEALKNVPDNIREASFALGATKLKTIFWIVLPIALPGILAGIILSIGKIVGESAALIYTSGTAAQIAGLFDSARTLSVHMYIISSEGLHINEAYSTAFILIILVLGINIGANFIVKKLGMK